MRSADTKRTEAARTSALADAESIVEMVREPVVVLDGHMRVQRADRSFYQTFAVSPEATEGRLLYDLGNGQWAIPRLRTLPEGVLSEHNVCDDYEVQHDFPGIGRKVMLLNARRVRREGTEVILLAIEDVTERRRLAAERKRSSQTLRASEERRQRMLTSTPSGC